MLFVILSLLYVLQQTYKGSRKERRKTFIKTEKIKFVKSAFIVNHCFSLPNFTNALHVATGGVGPVGGCLQKFW